MNTIHRQLQLPTRVTNILHIGGAAALDDAEYITSNDIGLVVDAANVLSPSDYVSGASASNDINIVRVHDFRDVEASADINPSASEQEKTEKIIAKTITIAKIGINTSRIIAQYIADNPGKNVLVNCAMGINRSAFIIAMYLKLYCGRTPAEIYNMLSTANSKRDLPALTNITFRKIIESV